MADNDQYFILQKLEKQLREESRKSIDDHRAERLKKEKERKEKEDAGLTTSIIGKKTEPKPAVPKEILEEKKEDPAAIIKKKRAEQLKAELEQLEKNGS